MKPNDSRSSTPTRKAKNKTNYTYDTYVRTANGERRDRRLKYLVGPLFKLI